jgi:hypothetical protein
LRGIGRRGVQKGVKRRGPRERTFKKEWLPFLEGSKIGEASANYLIRSVREKKVALFDRLPCSTGFGGSNPAATEREYPDSIYT